MGCFDSFVDGKKDVQLKNFGSSLHTYYPGDVVPMEKYNYPTTALFYCFVVPNDIVLIKKNKYKGIINKKQAIALGFKRIFMCDGEEQFLISREKVKK